MLKGTVVVIGVNGNINITATRRRWHKQRIAINPQPRLTLLHPHLPTFHRHQTVIIDEWHELIGSKRGILVELALSRLKSIAKRMKIWGISATIGNLDQAVDILLGSDAKSNPVVVKANVHKQIEARTILPDDIHSFPWAGHIGTRLLEKVMPILDRSKSTLIFTNTRSQAEIWFQNLLETNPDLAGHIALHHGSLDRSIRDYVEASLHEGSLKAVVCTSSLDLGVDFSPVETVVQIGSPKGVARYLQRAGRSGHQPGSTSTIYFVPTHALEIIEGAALKSAIDLGFVEERPPVIKPLDVLVQYLVTLAVSDGFTPDEVRREVETTFAFRSMTNEDWEWAFQFITTGGKSLRRYRDYSKVVMDEDGRYQVKDRRLARRHRMSIGTIASDSAMRVKFMRGGTLGTIEEYFIAGLKPGDVFWFAGRNLELVKVKEMTALVKKAGNKKGIVPSWMGGRMSLTSNLSEMLKRKLRQTVDNGEADEELQAIRPLIDLQVQKSHLPSSDQLLIEKHFSREGCHVYFFPFEGRYVHEGMASLMAWRIAQIQPISFSIAMNDYGFELLSDQDIPIEQALENDLFSTKRLIEDIFSSLNDTEMAKRKFREISQVAGLVFTGFPGQNRSNKHLQMSSGLLFDVFMEYEPEHKLIQQAYDEVLRYQLDEKRLRAVLNRVQQQEVVVRYPERFTPLCFPIMVDRLREKLSSESLIDRIMKIQAEMEA